MQKIVAKYAFSLSKEATTQDVASQNSYSFASHVQNFPGC